MKKLLRACLPVLLFWLLILGYVIKNQSGPMTIDPSDMQRLCEAYSASIKNEDWIRAYVLSAEIYTVREKANLSTPCKAIEPGAPYDMAHRLYPDEKKFRKAVDEQHQNIEKEGLCHIQLLKPPPRR